MKSLNKSIRILLIILTVLVLGVVGAWIGFTAYISSYYRADEAIINATEKELELLVEDYSDENGTVFLPKTQSPKSVIVFYPGGKVEYSAYKALMYRLSSKGYLCILPRMPGNLAVLNIGAVDDMYKSRSDDYDLASGLDWYLAGHSLGGVAASKYLKKDAGSGAVDFSGLILCASYPTEDLSESGLRFLSIYGDRDGVLNMDSYERSRSLWPTDSKEVVIEGGIHSFFGSYGIQKSDGEPLITNEEQLEETADIIDKWISEKDR